MLVDATVDMLRRHSPFDRMDQLALAFSGARQNSATSEGYYIVTPIWGR